MITLSPYERVLAVVLAAPGGLAIALGTLFGAGGLSPGAAVLIAASTAIPAAAVLTLIAAGQWPYARPSNAALVAAGGLIVFTAMAALSMTWSLSLARSRDDAILAAGYLGALILGGLLAPAVRRPGLVVAVYLTGVASLASLIALVTRTFTFTTGVQFTPRLSGPLSLPNAMAIMALAGLIGSMALCIHRDRRLRALGGGLVGLNALALTLTSSRSGLGLAVLALLAVALVLPAGPRMRLVPLVALIPATAIGFRVASWPAFTDPSKLVAAAGWGLLAATAASVVLGALIAFAADPVARGAGLDPDGPRGRASRRTLAIAGIVVLLGALAVVVRSGGPVGTVDAVRAGFSSPVSETGIRIGLGANFRDHWWGTAWRGFTNDPITGTGAGTFRLLEQTTSDPAFTTDSAHNTVLEAFAGTGIVGGLAMLIGGIGLVAMGVIGVRRARPGDEVGAVVAATAAIAFLLQGLVDVDWDLAAQGVAAFAAFGALGWSFAAASRPLPALRIGLAVLAVPLLVGGAFGVPTWLGARAVERSSALVAENPEAAYAAAISARRYDPLAVEPILAAADARERLGDPRGAQSLLVEAIDREPANYEPWLSYGILVGLSLGQTETGRVALERALRLSGGDPSVRGILDEYPPPG